MYQCLHERRFIFNSEEIVTSVIGTPFRCSDISINNIVMDTVTSVNIGDSVLIVNSDNMNCEPVSVCESVTTVAKATSMAAVEPPVTSSQVEAIASLSMTVHTMLIYRCSSI